MHKLTLTTEGDSDAARPLSFTKHRILDCAESCSSDLFCSKFNVGMATGLPSRVQKYVNTKDRMFQPRSNHRRGNILETSYQIWEEPMLQANPPREHCRYAKQRSLLFAPEGQWQTGTRGASEDRRKTWYSSRMATAWNRMNSAGVQVHLEAIVAVAARMQYLEPQEGVSG